jgi:hypothetical protein
LSNQTRTPPWNATCTATWRLASQRAARAKPALRTRFAKVAIALAVIYVMFIGERWVLEHSTRRERVDRRDLRRRCCLGDAIPPSACTKVGASDDK